jgi:hypothetical protein
MAENSDGVVVTEDIIAEAARVGDLRSLTDWARQGVRVRTAKPLNNAAQGGFLAVVRTWCNTWAQTSAKQTRMEICP